MKLLARISGILLTIVSTLFIIAAFIDLFGQKEGPGLMIGMMLFWACVAALGIWLLRRGFRKDAKTLGDLQPGASMNDALRGAAKLMAAKRYDETIAAYTAIAERSPRNRGVCYSQIGAAHYFKGDYQNAIQHYERALEHGADEAMMADNINEAREAMQGSPQETSASGSPIYRHSAAAPATDDVAHADDERLTAHLDSTLGSSDMVFHELVSDRVHIDVHCYPPNDSRPFNVLVTSGMSALPMAVPEDMEDRESWQHTELCLLLPPDWKLSEEDFQDERNYWPIRLLKMLSRLPHEYATWLGSGHSIPNGDPAAPYAPGTSLCGAVIIPPFVLEDEFFTVQGAPPIHIFQVLPVTGAEMLYKLDAGLDELLERLEANVADPYGALDPGRRSVC